MLNTVVKLLRTLRVPSAEELESAYLNGSANRYDLEQRQREIDSGRFRRKLAGYY